MLHPDRSFQGIVDEGTQVRLILLTIRGIAGE